MTVETVFGFDVVLNREQEDTLCEIRMSRKRNEMAAFKYLLRLAEIASRLAHQAYALVARAIASRGDESTAPTRASKTSKRADEHMRSNRIRAVTFVRAR